MPERYPPEDPREWLNRAHSNLILANIVPGNELYFEDLCYNSQQAAEKAIKAVCIANNIQFPYVHDLAALITVLLNHNISIPDSVQESAKLTRFAVATRYPHLLSPVSEQEYLRSVLIAENVVRWSEKEIVKLRADTDTS